MKLRIEVIGVAFAMMCATSLAQQAPLVLPLWPHGTPEPAQTDKAETNLAKAPQLRTTNITKPTLTLISPADLILPAEPRFRRPAVLVFPGGGYSLLAMDIEGLDSCRWLNAEGIVCVLVKYRVPENGHYPANYADLEDAQQAMRMTREHAAEWGIDANRLGVMGYSAGGNLAVLMCTHSDDAHVLSTPVAADVPMANGKPIDAEANFAILGYPAYLAKDTALTLIDPTFAPNTLTPPTFLAVAEDDKTWGANSIVYYRALLDAKIPAEMIAYPTGGHGFGTYPKGRPEEHWTDLAAEWLRLIKILPTN